MEGAAADYARTCFQAHGQAEPTGFLVMKNAKHEASYFRRGLAERDLPFSTRERICAFDEYG